MDGLGVFIHEKLRSMTLLSWCVYSIDVFHSKGDDQKLRDLQNKRNVWFRSDLARLKCFGSIDDNVVTDTFTFYRIHLVALSSEFHFLFDRS